LLHCGLNRLPDVSVVVCTFNRPLQLARALSALARQDYPEGRFEVIVVDDGGSQPLESVISPFLRSLQIRVLRQENAGPGAARNTGATAARGALLAFTDDDCEPEPGWLAALSSAADGHPGALLGGRTSAGLPDRLCSAASQLIQDIVYDFYNADPENAAFFASNNMAVPADAFRSLGGFDPRFHIASEDRDLCRRWRMAGGRMVYVPNAAVRHLHPMTLAGYVRQHFRYGRGAARFHRQCPSGSPGLREHVGFHRQWQNWLFRPLREGHGPRAAALSLLLLVWQAANAAGFLYGWLSEDVPRR
jgi:GT2 family glycosyltransferase